MLGWLIGDAEDGVRVWGPERVVERVGGDLVSRDRSPGVKFQAGSFAGERGTPLETGQARAERVEYRCRRKCGAIYPRQRSKVVVAFVRAARATRTALTFDEDL